MPGINKHRQSDLPLGIHSIAKPIGATCNFSCDYCFYLEKDALYPNQKKVQMPDDILKQYIKNYVLSQPTPEVEFVWHGGEPTLAGIDFFRKVIKYQRPYRKTKTIRNSIQTNGSLLTDEWCRFFKENLFFVGISLDGPEDIHDRYRRKRGGGSTFKTVMKGLKLLKKHDVAFNVLACVAKDTAFHPLKVYRFFKSQGVEFIQFTPVIERQPDKKMKGLGLSLAAPSALNHEEMNKEVTPWTVAPHKYGDFLIAVFDEWVRNDVGKTFVMNFEWALNVAFGNPSPVCMFSRQCGRAVAVEHNGDVYACDHYVYPEYQLGNLLNRNLSDMVEASVENGFGPHKEHNLPNLCNECNVLQACWGGCPKHRFMKTADNEPGLHYLCAGYKKFFTHISKYMTGFQKLLEYGLEPDTIMQAIDSPLMIPASAKTGNQQILLWIK